MIVPTNRALKPVLPMCATDANAEKVREMAAQVVIQTFSDFFSFSSSVSWAMRQRVEKRHTKAHMLSRRLSRDVDSAARADVPALSVMVKFSFADAVADMKWFVGEWIWGLSGEMNNE